MNRPSSLSLTVAAFFSCFAIQAYSAPIISNVANTVSNNGTITITGSGFGDKSTGAPLLWDTFESGANGRLVGSSAATIGNWDSSSFSPPKYSTAKPYAGSVSSYHAFGPEGYNLSLPKNVTFSRLYMDFWMYVSHKGTMSRNFKPWRFYGDNDSLQTNYVWYCDGHALTLPNGKNDWGGVNFTNNTWYHFQLLYVESPVGASGGLLRQYINGKMTHEYTGATRTKDVHFNQVRIGHYWALDGAGCPANSGADVYVDNVYIDTSLAHIEIGDRATYGSSSLREIQIPREWSDNSVTVTVNQGSFRTGDTAYLYVVNGQGVVNSAGYPITIGGTSASPTSLPAPEGLQVVQ